MCKPSIMHLLSYIPAVHTELLHKSPYFPNKLPVQPVCRPGQKIMYGVAKQETAVVRCQTDAIPPVNKKKINFFFLA